LGEAKIQYTKNIILHVHLCAFIQHAWDTVPGIKS